MYAPIQPKRQNDPEKRPFPKSLQLASNNNDTGKPHRYEDGRNKM